MANSFITSTEFDKRVAESMVSYFRRMYQIDRDALMTVENFEDKSARIADALLSRGGAS